MSENKINWDTYLQVASLSDIGMRRSNNQDNFTVSYSSTMDAFHRKGHIFIVADGMGAHAAGELASKLAVDHIPHLYDKYNDISAPEALKKAVTDANSEINRRGSANEDFHNMGTTCSVLNILPQGAVIAHIGDSRVYRLRKNRLEQLTFDHSLFWEMKYSGQLTLEEENSGKIPKNVITRSLGPYPDCKVDLEGPFPLVLGDTFLLCSDGLTGVIEDNELGSILSNFEPSEAARVLVDLANLRGGPDNITVIIVKVVHPQMATNANTNPLTVNSRKGKFKINAITWAIFGILAVLTALIYVFNGWQTAIVPGILALGTLGWILVRLAMGASSGQTVSATKRFGKGPYIRCDSLSGGNFAKQLDAITIQLEKGAVQQQWKVDLNRFRGLVKKSQEAFKAGDHSASIRGYGRSISFLMDQLRNQTDGSSSSIDL